MEGRYLNDQGRVTHGHGVRAERLPEAEKERRVGQTETATKGGLALPRVIATVVLVGGVLLWAYWPTLRELVDRWSRDPQYTHGYLVPLFSIALLWLKRGELDLRQVKTSWWGLPVLTAAVGIFGAGAYFSVPWLDNVSLFPCLVGVALLWGGWHFLKWSALSIAFLIFTIPLPFFVQTMLSQPLQHVATVWSTYCLQLAGIPAMASGNVIVIGQFQLFVADACSGLSMLMTFFALTTAFVCLVERSWPNRIAIVASAIPIAVIANVARITATGILHETAGGHISSQLFHDWAGVFMMPLALLLLLVELWFLDRLFVAIPLRERGPGLTIGNLRGQPNQFPT